MNTAKSFSSLARGLLLGLSLAITASLTLPATAQTTFAEWQAKAVAEYPSLGVADSDLNLKFRSRVAELKKTNPDYFNDPKWPYTLAKSLDPSSQIIPGLDIPPPAASPAPTPDNALFKLSRIEGQTTKLPVYQANILSDLFAKNSLDAPAYKQICVEGSIKSQYFDPVGDGKKFYVILEPNLACEFHTTGFVDANRSYISNFSTASTTFLDVRNKEGQATLYQGVGYNYYGTPKGFKPLKTILNPAENLTVVGRIDGLAKVDGLASYVVLRDCAIRRVYTSRSQ